MVFSKSQVIRLTVILLLLCCTLFANFIAVRMMLRYGIDAYFYDKLLVAYNIGGLAGLKTELDKISVTDKLRRESILAKNFSAQLETLPDPKAFLTDKVQKSKNMAFFIRNMRSAAIVLMVILFGWQVITSSASKLEPKNSSSGQDKI